MSTSPLRADTALVQRGHFESRAKAQEAIAAGLVSADGKIVRKSSELLGVEAQIEASKPYPWVSRGGLKLVAALDAFGFDPEGQTCLDIGSSTGGFTDVLLSRGASRVYAVDVGHGQLHESLRGEPRVISMESTDARALTAAHFAQPPSLIVCDASFISLRLILPNVLSLAAPGAALAALVKPQFEAGPAHVVKGIVRDEKARTRVCAEISDCVRGLGWTILGLKPSPIAGGDGNLEFLIGARRA
jgi:23S rRNA (cytidine1920-2'-O)/16S rRNA (cytidine1409-2'-O)-methyltransferase